MKIREIIRHTAEAFDVTPEQIVGRESKRRRVQMARACAMYLARRYTDRSYPLIGREFGGRNHSTIIKAIRDYPARASWYGFSENMLKAQNAVASR
jgi:chromosomal replication initiator protein